MSYVITAVLSCWLGWFLCASCSLCRKLDDEEEDDEEE